MDDIWAVREDFLGEIRAWMEAKAKGTNFIESRSLQKRPAIASGSVSIGVLPVYGVLSFRPSVFDVVFGFGSVERLSEDFETMVKDAKISSIVLDVDSPGGSVFGVMEFAEQIREARKKKKIVAVANPQAASAAYHIASAASEVVIAPSGSVGSIGAFLMHQDYSEALKQEGIHTTFIKAGKYKVEGNFYEPLTDEAKAALQERVDAYYDMFVSDVAKGRGVSVSDVRNGFGQGRMVMAKDAVKAGMADRVGTFKDTISRLTGGGGASSSRFGASSQAEREAVLRELEIEETDLLIKELDRMINQRKR